MLVDNKWVVVDNRLVGNRRAADSRLEVDHNAVDDVQGSARDNVLRVVGGDVHHLVVRHLVGDRHLLLLVGEVDQLLALGAETERR